ncbi:DUF4240 domain-containing protein [Aliikangiella sp. IMCC44653]
MNEDTFWRLVTASPNLPDAESIGAALTQKLEPLSNQELADFDKHFSLKMRASYTWALFGAAFVIAGCNTEYAFAEFRCWLISCGKATFDKALNDPDSLAEGDIIPFKDDEASPYLDEYDLIAGLIYEQRTGKELPFVPSGQLEPKGKRFKDKPKFLRQSYPNLFAKYWVSLN